MNKATVRKCGKERLVQLVIEQKGMQAPFLASASLGTPFYTWIAHLSLFSTIGGYERSPEGLSNATFGLRQIGTKVDTKLSAQ